MLIVIGEWEAVGKGGNLIEISPTFIDPFYPSSLLPPKIPPKSPPKELSKPPPRPLLKLSVNMLPCPSSFLNWLVFFLLFPLYFLILD